MPRSSVTVMAHSTPVTLGSARVGQGGSFEATVALPPSLETGAHHVVVIGTLKSGAVVAQEEAFTVATGDRLGSIGTLPPVPLQNDVGFEPLQHKGAVLATTAGTVTVLGAVAASLGGGLTGGRGAPVRGGTSGGGSGGGYLEDVELERSEAEDEERESRRSGVERLPWTRHVDRYSRDLPSRLAAISPVIGRVAVDGDYLRALFGSLWLFLCAGAVALGLYASASTGWYAVPPTLGLFLAILGLSIFDSTLGYLAGVAFSAGALFSGHITTPPEVRLGAGVVLVWFAVPLAAAALRPLRRAFVLSPMGIWDRAADFVIGGLFAAWAAQKMVGALSGLVGVELPIGQHVNAIAFAVLGFVLVRIVAESLIMRGLPSRLAAVAHEGGLESETLQIGISLVIQIALFCFIAVSYMGWTWGLYVGCAVFFAPLIPWLFADRIPKSKLVTRWKPRGLINWSVIIVFGVVLSRLLEHLVHSASLVETLGFIILPLPILISWGLELFEDEEADEHEVTADSERELVAVGATSVAGEGEHARKFAGIDWTHESARSAFRELDSERREREEEHEQVLPPWRLWLTRLAGLPLVVLCVYLVVTHIAGG
jgi:hypothetical protein